MSNETPLLEVKDLSVTFGEGETKNQVVNHVSFDIKKGETLALVGESGSGKSVTAMSILQLLPASAKYPSGEIYFDGTDLMQVDDAILRDIRGSRVTVIFQEPMTSLNPLHTIEKQIGEILKLHKNLTPDEIHARVIELLELVQIRDAKARLKDYPHQLSGGQRQRVMIAMAIANEPELLIADEPTTALDVTVQAQILELLGEIQKRMGMAVLLITHDLGIVERISDRICVMNSGKIVEHGETAKIFSSPEHDYTKHLLSCEPSGQPVKPADDAPDILETTDLKVWFPIKRGLLKRTVDHMKAVDGISLKVRAGETIGVVGESGSGKTTLGQALLRLISSDGPIRFLNEPIEQLSFKDMRSKRSDAQIVFQDPFGSLSPRMSIGRIIGEGLEIHNQELGSKEREEIIIEALKEVNLDPEMRHRYPHEFSGGQRQRIAIARAMVLHPKFVVLDEPTSALDMSVQAQMVELLRELQSRYNLAYLFISHDLKVVRAMSNYVIVMRLGKVVEEGPADQIFDNPQEDYTKALMAAAFDITATQSAIISQ